MRRHRGATAPRELGAYGLRLRAEGLAARWLLPQDPGAPALELAVRVRAPDWSPPRLDALSADLRLVGGGRLQARRGERQVTFSLPAPIGADELVHPYLAPAAALVWQWAGAEALHAGVLAIADGAVLVLGDKASGKSTTLAWLAIEHGATVLADDLAVIRAGCALAGPRSVDLRPSDPSGAVLTREGDRSGDTAHPCDLSSLTVVRRGDRTRVELGPAPASLPVVGAFALAWGPRALQAVPAHERLPALMAQRSYPLPGDPRALLDLAACPMFRLTRPRSPAERGATAAALLRCFAQ